ncbi:MMPL family transporter [Spongisporangium articulatum]|uniref:MMPL family transporter n=1 Tax=Spongisporangium articulatum TaxID=3362603 RepID=A0ABW8AJI1_9ACTN
MSTVLYRLGRAAYRERGVVIGCWVALLVLLGALVGLLGPATDNAFTIPGTQSQQALDQLNVQFPEAAGGTAQYVVVAPRGAKITDDPFRGIVRDGVRRLEALQLTGTVTDPFAKDVRGALSGDGRAALINVQLNLRSPSVTPDQRAELEDAVAPVTRQLSPYAGRGAAAALGGPALATEQPTISPTEGLGLLVALVVLLITFGSLRAAGMPLLSALAGVGVTMTVVLGASALTRVSSTAPLLALMIGLAVGIDYALFVLSRHRHELAEGRPPEEAAARAVATAGSAVVFAGLTVIIALLGLAVARIPFLTTMGLAAAFAVLVAVLVSLTLLPALFALAGGRVTPKARRHPHRRTGFAGRWVHLVTRAPLVTTVVVVLGLGTAALPALDLRLALPDGGSAPVETSQRQTYDLVSEHFGAGYNGPLLMTADIIASTDPLGVVDGIAKRLRGLEGVEAVTLATPNRTADLGLFVVIPTTGPDSPATSALVNRMRDLAPEFRRTYGVDTAVTGQTALAIDVSDRLGAALVPFGIVVVGLCLLLLGLVFRSVAVPLKAAIGYLFSVGVSFGAVTAVFQWGWFADLLGVPKTGPVISFLPIILMGVLFGLAMDYEVFLVSRMREIYVHTGDVRAAVQQGFQASAGVVTAAAVIMFAVFAAFIPEGDTSIKPIALALAVGVFVDAFVVRMTLVPAVLTLLGRSAWWLPAWLDRRLPSVDVEGDGLRRELALQDWRTPEDAAVVAEELSLEGPAGPVFTDVGITLPEGSVLVVHGAAGSGKTSLLLVLAGRMAFSSGRLRVAGVSLPGHRAALRRRVGLGEVVGVNDLEDGLSVEQHVAERIAVRSVRPWVSRAAVNRVLDQVDDAVLAATDSRRPLGRRTLVADLDPLQRLLLGCALGLIGRPQVLVVDDVDRARSRAGREAVWRGLAWLARPGLTVVATSQSPEDAYAAVPAEQLYVLDLSGSPVVPVEPDRPLESDVPVESDVKGVL